MPQYSDCFVSFPYFMANDGQHRREQKEKDADNEMLSLCLYQLKPNHTVVVLNK